MDVSRKHKTSIEIVSQAATALLILLGIVATGLAFSQKHRDAAIWVGFAAGVCGCLWFCSWLQDYLWKQDAEEASHTSERPILEPMLVIDLVSSNKVLCHYEIQNTGKTTAYDVRSQESGNGFWAGQFVSIITELAPNGKASVMSIGNFGAHTKDSGMFFRRLTLT